MKNKILYFTSFCAGCMLFAAACTKTEDADSVAKPASAPHLITSYLEDVYIFGEGNTAIYSTLPDVIAIAVDDVWGFEGGYGGKTGQDTVKIHKSEITFGDTVSVGGTSFVAHKYTKGNYRVSVGSSIVIASANNNPGPTALEGNYLRKGTSYLLDVKKVANGIYLITNPGGAATIPPNPYLLYNFKSFTGMDSLSFAIQTDLCGGGTQLVSPGAPPGLKSSEYSAQYPPKIIQPSGPDPLTLTWVVYSFSAVDEDATQGVVCNWGGATRIFLKQ